MTKEEIIDNIARLNSQTWKDREEVRTKIGRLLSELKKALEQPTSEDRVSRKAVFETIDDCNSDGLKGIFCSYDDGERFKEYVKMLPPVTPTQSTCKDCKYWKDSDGVYRRGIGAESKCPINNSRVFDGTFCCADFEKRGNENGSN